jgi:beta-lactamase class A
MKESRASFLRAAGAAAAAVPLGGAAARTDFRAAKRKIQAILAAMPGRSAAALHAADGSFSFERDPASTYSVGSCFKAFVAAQAYREIAAGRATLTELLPLNESVYMPGATAFVPQLEGKVPLQVALQEMIAYSDNTATDMVMKRFGVQNIRAFVAGAGFKSVRIPESTRAVFSYAAGMPIGTVATYRQLFGLDPAPPGLVARSVANDTVGMRSSMNDLVAFYRRSLAGEFFKGEALEGFRITMSTGSGLAEKAVPHGSAAYMKGGSYNGPDCGIAVAGAMLTGTKTLYFAIAANWTGEAGWDAKSAAFLASAKEILRLARA